jgi:hypothetical protein
VSRNGRRSAIAVEVPPHDLDAERAVLGAPLTSEEPAQQARILATIVEQTTPDMFFSESHRIVRRRLEAMRGGLVTWRLLLGALADAGELEDVGGPPAIALLVEQGCLEGYVPGYLAKVREKFVARRRQQIGLTLSGAPNGTPLGLAEELRATREQLAELERMLDGVDEADPDLVDVTEILATRYEEAPAIIGGGVVVRKGLSVWAARAKTGKTALATQAVITRGLEMPFLGLPTTSGRTLYLSAEHPRQSIQSRVRLQMPDGEVLPAGSIWFVAKKGIHIDQPAGLRKLRRLIELAQPDLVVLDTFAKFISVEENSNREIGRVVSTLDELMETYALAFLILHHTGKPSAGDTREGGERLRGASALYAAADSILILDRESDGHFKLSFELRHAAEREPMRLERSDRLWFSEAGPAEDLLVVASAVADVGLRYKGLKNALQQDADVKERTAERMIARARKAGLIALDDDNLYRATAKYRHARGDGVAIS